MFLRSKLLGTDLSKNSGRSHAQKPQTPSTPQLKIKEKNAAPTIEKDDERPQKRRRDQSNESFFSASSSAASAASAASSSSSSSASASASSSSSSAASAASSSSSAASSSSVSSSTTNDRQSGIVTRIFTIPMLRKAIKILRGNSSETTNCIQLAHGLMEYLKTGKPPTTTAAAITGNAEHVKLFPVVDRHGKTTRFDVQNGSVALSRHKKRIQGTRCNYSELRQELRNQARHFGSPIYGFVVLVSANEKASHDGHVIPFYAKPDIGEWAPYEISFIDGHNISEGECLTEPVSPSLQKGGYSFIDFASKQELKAKIAENAKNEKLSESNVDLFQSECFYFIEGAASVLVFEPENDSLEKGRTRILPRRLQT